MTLISNNVFEAPEKRRLRRSQDRACGLREAMRMVIDEFTLAYPGINNVEHDMDFYAVYGADDATRRGYLEKYALGRQF